MCMNLRPVPVNIKMWLTMLFFFYFLTPVQISFIILLYISILKLWTIYFHKYFLTVIVCLKSSTNNVLEWLKILSIGNFIKFYSQWMINRAYYIYWNCPHHPIHSFHWENIHLIPGLQANSWYQTYTREFCVIKYIQFVLYTIKENSWNRLFLLNYIIIFN